MRYTNTHLHRQGTDAKVAVPKEGAEETLAFSEWRMATLSSRKRARKIKAFGTQRCIFTKSEINRMQLMLQIEISFMASC